MISQLAGASAYQQIQSLTQGQEGKPSGALVDEFASVFERTEAIAARFATKNVDTQQLVEALSEAEMALQAAMTVRDKLVSAYQDIIRMPL
jgi:flagellar hook-basal body complex protein FliE